MCVMNRLPDPPQSYQEKEAGKLVMYTTNLGVIRDTYHKCQKAEFRERTQSSVINVPLVYKEGVLLGDAEKLEKLNETGELRRLLKPFKRSEPEVECKKCGGYRMLPCGVCNGSKKSSHRNNFTLDFIALKCMNCDEAGLVKCDSCNNNH
ncbi:unnamed protein product [Notodromas monacha]|uniref:Glutaredoxin domain-containing cysteine-rich protein 1 n=1 Tax=Notodromas monacha TaxID=399045 RepID=A0A7R9GIF2_9CRUS|nr:unnamed protein product [Notodromas monacha]CAG0921709.1 unnamed protein product [Notodromas monacha]